MIASFGNCVSSLTSVKDFVMIACNGTTTSSRSSFGVDWVLQSSTILDLEAREMLAATFRRYAGVGLRNAEGSGVEGNIRACARACARVYVGVLRMAEANLLRYI